MLYDNPFNTSRPVIILYSTLHEGAIDIHSALEDYVLYSKSLPSGNSSFDVDIALFDNHIEIIPEGSHHRRRIKEKGIGKCDG